MTIALLITSGLCSGLLLMLGYLAGRSEGQARQLHLEHELWRMRNEMWRARTEQRGREVNGRRFNL